MKKVLVAVILGGLVLTGCGSNKAEESSAAVLSEESTQAEKDGKDTEAQESSDGQDTETLAGADEKDVESQAGTDEQETEIQEETKADSVFTKLPDQFVYSSGAGGWATELYLNDDGTFNAQYHDSDLGYTGADYPNGTVYISNYSGKFTEPQAINEYTYSMTVEYIEQEMEAGQEYYEDGKRYVTCGASELADAGELLVYMPGARKENLPEEFISWANYGDFGPENDFRCFGIYNPAQQLAFIGYHFTAFEELQKLSGTFRNENGDEFVMDIYQDSENLVDDIGSAYWTPHGGETEFGHVYKLAEGGFKIALPESKVYYFEITDNNVNHTQFAGDEISGELGTFTKVE